MTDAFTPDGLARARRRRVAADVFLRLNTTPKIARAWSGVGGFTLPADAVETEGGRYKGVGWMQNLPQLNVLLNGRAESATFILPGVDARTVELVDQEADPRGVTAHLGVMFYGPRWQRTPVMWFRRYRVDAVGTRELGLSDDGGSAAVEYSVSLTLGSSRTSRRVGQPSFWTHAEQTRLHPGDNGMSLVSRLGPGATRPHPPKA
jgi:hypothetical protein